MSEVDALERDVEAARARLVSRVAQLNSPPLSEVKDELVAEATEYKDQAIDQAKQKLTDAIDGFVSDLKRRAADNPVAVAAIGAGIAWRLWQKPPIATLLVGAGIAALFGRSSVHEVEVDPYDADRPTSYVPGGVGGYGYGTTAGAIEQKVIGGATVALETARGKAGELLDKANELKDRAIESAGELRDNVLQSAGDFRDGAVRSADELRKGAIRSSGQAVDRLPSMTADARSRVRPAREYAEDMVRDNGVYLGIAALAIGAATGIGLMQMNKPLSHDAEDEGVRLE